MRSRPHLPGAVAKSQLIASGGRASEHAGGIGEPRSSGQAIGRRTGAPRSAPGMIWDGIIPTSQSPGQSSTQSAAPEG